MERSDGRALSAGPQERHVAATVRRLLTEAVDLDLLASFATHVESEARCPGEARSERAEEASRRVPGVGGLGAPLRRADPRGAARPLCPRVPHQDAHRRGRRAPLARPRHLRPALGRLEVRTAWNSRTRLEKQTKTLFEKTVPLHPLLAAILEGWKAEGWKRYVGRDPAPDDLIVPSELGRRRSASHSNRLFQDDVRRLELEKKGTDGQPVRRTHYETRATFRSLALAGGAVREDLDLITHPSPRHASDLIHAAGRDLAAPLPCSEVRAGGPSLAF